MIGLITLIALIISVINGYLVIKIDKKFTLGITICVLSIFLLITHIFLWGTASYRYNLIVNEKSVIEQTLKSLRNNNQYETATIGKNIVQWNVELTKMKYNNKIFFFTPYIDNKIETLKPIK